MSQLDVIVLFVIVGYMYFYFYSSFTILDLYQVWVFGIFRFADILVQFWSYFTLVSRLTVFTSSSYKVSKVVNSKFKFLDYWLKFLIKSSVK